MNTSVHDTSWHSPYSIVWQGIVWLVVFLLSLETIIGNAMVIVAYKIERSISKQVSNRYIVSLAISDLIIGIEGFPLFTVYVLNGQRWPLGAIACETWLFLDYTLCLVSILTVLLITADRYLSVCHTAKYLKWQSPTKTWVLIVFSWIIPALIFGIMIYGWNAMTGLSTSMNGAECSAPFLSNPYVNMGMYVAYYWTTLVAMLILYKGIHQAAKNLEKKAKAKERRHIALILSQRLGTQVGVSLMLQSRAEKEKAEQMKNKKMIFGRRRGFAEPERPIKENGDVKKNDADDAEKNLTVIEEERSQFESFCRRESHELPLPAPNSSAANSRRESEEQDALLNKDDSVIVSNRTRLSLKSTASRCSIAENIKRTERLEKMNNNRTNPPDSGNESDNSLKSFKVRNSKRHRRKTSRPGSLSSRSRGSSKRASRIKRNNEHIEVLENDNSSNRSEKWVTTIKKRISRALERKISIRRRERSSSSSSTSSSGEGYADPSVTSSSTKANVPQLVITEQHEPCVNEPLSPTKKSETSFLSTASVSRKISSLSTTLTRERVISSIFAPITVFNRRRKQTKAEKRAHKAFRTITFIVGCFAILWSPYYIMATVYGFCKGECIPSFLYTLSYYMCYLNSSGNPFAYALANRQFRSAFMRIFRGNFHNNAT